MNCKKNICYLCSNHFIHGYLEALNPLSTVNKNLLKFKMISEEIIDGLKREIEVLKKQIEED